MLRNTLRRNKGITLIALVVTIIVLLILAGISIVMLTGQNGILNRAAEAKEKTGVAQEEENEKLQGYEDTINQYAPSSNGGSTGGGSEGGNPTGGSLSTGTGTTPYLPNSTFSKKEGDLATGLVIQDANQNEYVWVEVPTTIYDNTTYNNNGAKKPSNSEDYTNIEACLKAYTTDYANPDYSDTNSNFTVQYQAMLKSVYTNGGFWIGRYEAGLEGDTPRTSYTEISESDKAVIKPNMYPYNYVTRDEAQTLAQKMNYGDCKGSLIFGVQWDLVLKYIETKNPSQKSNLLENSTTIGNYNNNLWKITNANAKYSIDNGKNFKECPYEKKSNDSVLLTTGALEAANLQNIYDIAGNVHERTLEKTPYDSYPCAYRGGGFLSNGSVYPASYRDASSMSSSGSDIGFRFSLY